MNPHEQYDMNRNMNGQVFYWPYWIWWNMYPPYPPIINRPPYQQGPPMYMNNGGKRPPQGPMPR